MAIYLIRMEKPRLMSTAFTAAARTSPRLKREKAELRNLHYEIPNVHFLTNGMKRANETMELLFLGISNETDSRFREVDFGAFEMHSYDDLKDRPDYQAWITRVNGSNLPPGGESSVQMPRRVLVAFPEIRDDTCLVTHGGVIAAILAHLFPDAGKKPYQWQLRNGHGYCLTEDGYRIMYILAQIYLKTCHVKRIGPVARCELCSRPFFCWLDLESGYNGRLESTFCCFQA